MALNAEVTNIYDDVPGLVDLADDSAERLQGGLRQSIKVWNGPTGSGTGSTMTFSRIGEVRNLSRSVNDRLRSVETQGGSAGNGLALRFYEHPGGRGRSFKVNLPRKYASRRININVASQEKELVREKLYFGRYADKNNLRISSVRLIRK